jgi:hypothetical protein
MSENLRLLLQSLNPTQQSQLSGWLEERAEEVRTIDAVEASLNVFKAAIELRSVRRSYLWARSLVAEVGSRANARKSDVDMDEFRS